MSVSSNIKKIVAGAASAAVVLSMTACADTTWSYKVGEEVIPAGVYIYYQTEGYAQAFSELVQQDYTIYYTDDSILDMEMPDGTKVSDYINDYAVKSTKQYYAIEKMFDELGLEITEEENRNVLNTVNDAMNQNQDGYNNLGIASSSLKAVQLNAIKEDKIFEKYYEVGGLSGVSEDDIKNYFNTEYARAKIISFSLVDSEGNALDDDAKAEMLEVANGYLERAKNGEDFDALIEECDASLEAEDRAQETDDSSSSGTEENTEDTENTENTDGEQAEDSSEETADNTESTEGAENTEDTEDTENTENTEDTDGAETDEETDEEEDPYKNENLYKADGEYPSTKFIDYLFNTAKENEPTLLQDDNYYYLVLRLPTLERTDIYDTYRSSLLYELKGDEFDSLLEEWTAEYTFTENTKGIKKFKLEKLEEQ